MLLAEPITVYPDLECLKKKKKEEEKSAIRLVCPSGMNLTDNYMANALMTMQQALDATTRRIETFLNLKTQAAFDIAALMWKSIYTSPIGLRVMSLSLLYVATGNFGKKLEESILIYLILLI